MLRPTFRCLALASGLGAIAACHSRDDAGAPAAPSADPRTRTPAGAGPAISSPAAFDVTAALDGAALAFAAPSGPAGETRILLAVLDADGAPKGEPQLVATTSGAVLEVAAAAVGSHVTLSWIEAGAGHARVLASVVAAGEDRAVTPAAASTLAEIAPSVARRGHVALAVGVAGEVVALHRGPDEPCRTGAGERCTTFVFHELSLGGATPRGFSLSVPDACAGGVAGLALARGIWHYAVCTHESGRPITALYTIESDPMYAQSERVLAGCEPEGLARGGTEALLVAHCDGGRRGWAASRLAAAGESVDLAHASVQCDGEALEARLWDARARRIRFDAPASRLELLLPERIAPRGSRAAWTGRALIVAASEADRIVVRRWYCSGAQLVTSATL
jgi:hypothetical protein